ncbi:MAG TPA: hypothetical protein VL614_00705 [Acetobacteraceae bacterium]|jgi:hypothetical protein|nr:hypothetical protein [Acetobacteraceae bacterium]
MAVPHLMPVGLTGIPRADAEIHRTIATLRVVQFDQDPLWDAADSFRKSLMNSAEKREGTIIEAAIRDAIEQTSHLRLVTVDRRLPRVPDVQFEIRDSGWIVALEIKRGSHHDSTKLRQFRDDLKQIPPLLRTALPLFPAECVHFHIVFISGQPPLSEGLTLDDLGKLYDLHARSHILTARQRYSGALKAIMRERGL